MWGLVLRPRRRGVKCVLHDREGRVLFVRHTYGNRRVWELPGGGAHRGESAEEAVRREAREELGQDVAEWRSLGTIEGTWHGARLTIDCLAAPWPDGAAVDADPVEIASCDWFPPSEPPRPLGEVTTATLPVLAGL